MRGRGIGDVVDGAAADAGRAVEQANRELVLQYFRHAWRHGDLEWAEAAITADFVMNRPDGTVLRGFETWRRGALHMRAAFDDIRFEIRHVIAEGDVVAVHSTVSGVHVGEFMGHHGTGRKISAVSADFYRIRDGRLVEHWNLADVSAILRQIGSVPGDR